MPEPQALLKAATLNRAGAPSIALCERASLITANGLWRHSDFQVRDQRCEAEESDFFTAGSEASEARYTQTSTSVCCGGAFSLQKLQATHLVRGQSVLTDLLVVPAPGGIRIQGQLDGVEFDQSHSLREPYGPCTSELRGLGVGQALRRSRFDPMRKAVVISETRLIERAAGLLSLEVQEGRQIVRLTLGEGDLLPRAFSSMGLTFEPCEVGAALAAREAAR